MSVKSLSPGLIALVFLALSLQRVEAQLDRSAFVSDASYVVGTHEPASRDHSPESMAKAAAALIAALDESQLEQLRLPLDSPERREWTNLPSRPGDLGLRFGSMNEQQVRAACDLMATLLSEQGYRKICHIMLADDQLLDNGQPRSGLGTEQYAIVLFGEPAADGQWAFQIDGHHVGVNVSISGEDLSISPSFIGTQPESFSLGGEKIRPLGRETDLAYELVSSLSDDQRRAAVVSPRRGQIVSGPGRDGQIPEQEGLSCKDLNDDQRAALVQLAACWINDLPESHAARQLAAFEAGVDETRFSWNGGVEPRSDISFRIQGPSVIIEFACQSMGGNPLDHLHTMYRDPGNEYGGQLDD